MKRERYSKIVFGNSSPSVNDLRTALDTIEADLSADAEITVHSTGSGHISAIVGLTVEGDE